MILFPSFIIISSIIYSFAEDGEVGNSVPDIIFGYTVVGEGVNEIALQKAIEMISSYTCIKFQNVTENFIEENISTESSLADFNITESNTTENILTTKIPTTNILTTEISTTNIVTTTIVPTDILTTKIPTTNISTTEISTTNVTTTEISPTNITTTTIAPTEVSTTNVTRTKILTINVTTRKIKTTKKRKTTKKNKPKITTTKKSMKPKPKPKPRKSQINKNKTKKNKKKKSSLKKTSQNKTEPKKVSKRSIEEMRVIKISKMSGMKNFSYDGSDNLIIYGNGCNKSPGCIARLLMQRLYIALTVQRYDRDKYITVNNDSILQGYIKDYMINETFDTFSGPFDFGSIMFPDRRYGSFLFRDTFTSINITQYGFMAGQMYNISFTDMRMLDYFYCNLTSPPLVTCQNNGYPNPKNNYRCKCPNGYTGRYCEELEGSSKGCPEQQIIVTKFNTTLEFNQTRRCNVNLTAPEGKRIHIYLNRTNAGVGTPCFERRGLEIKLLEDKSITGLCLCGFGSNMHLTSEGDSVFIQYNGIAVANKAVLYHCIEGECDNSLIKHPNGSEEEYNDEEEDSYY